MRYLLTLMLLIGACALPLFAQDSADAGTVAAILALEHAWTVGQSRNDNRALNLIFDNDLIYVEYGNLVSKADYLSRVRQEAPELDQIVMERTIVRVFGSTAIVTGAYIEKQLHSGRQSVRRWRFIDTWVYQENGWTLVAAGASPVTK